MSTYWIRAVINKTSESGSVIVFVSSSLQPHFLPPRLIFWLTCFLPGSDGRHPLPSIFEPYPPSFLCQILSCSTVSSFLSSTLFFLELLRRRPLIWGCCAWLERANIENMINRRRTVGLMYYGRAVESVPVFDTHWKCKSSIWTPREMIKYDQKWENGETLLVHLWTHTSAKSSLLTKNIVI